MMQIMKRLMLAAALAASGCESDDDDDVSADASLDAAVPEAGVDARAPDGGADASLDLQRVEIRFRAKVGNQELVCGQNYDGLGTTGASGTPQDFRFFVEQVRLINARGQEVPLVFEERSPHQAPQVALIDLTDGAGACGASGASTTNMVITGHVPRDTYDGVVIVNGVPASLNNAAPGEAPAPLRAPGAHWGWRDGYRFMMAELRSVEGHDELGDAGGGSHHAGDAGGHNAGESDAGAHDAGASDAGSPHGSGGGASFVHTGSTGCSGTPGTGITCNTDSFRANRAEVRLPRFNPATQYVVADLGAVFAGIDLKRGAVCHGTGAACAPMLTALGIDPATGRPVATQTVFRVE